MEPWVVAVIFVSFVIFITVILLVVLIKFGNSGRGSIGRKGVIDLSKWEDQKRVILFVPHKDLFTGDFKNATENKDVITVRERGMMKRPEHHFRKDEITEMQDSETGFHLIIHGGKSVFAKEADKQVRILKTELEKANSEKSLLLAENLYIKKHLDKEVLKRMDEAGTLNKQFRYFENNKTHKK